MNVGCERLYFLLGKCEVQWMLNCFLGKIYLYWTCNKAVNWGSFWTECWNRHSGAAFLERYPQPLAGCWPWHAGSLVTSAGKSKPARRKIFPIVQPVSSADTTQTEGLGSAAWVVGGGWSRFFVAMLTLLQSDLLWNHICIFFQHSKWAWMLFCKL